MVAEARRPHPTALPKENKVGVESRNSSSDLALIAIEQSMENKDGNSSNFVCCGCDDDLRIFFRCPRAPPKYVTETVSARYATKTARVVPT
jgi:hypothetical protein